MEVILDQCPFCGESEDLEIYKHDRGQKEGIPTAITCGSCGCTGPWAYTKYGTIEASLLDSWNGRYEES